MGRGMRLRGTRLASYRRTVAVTMKLFRWSNQVSNSKGGSLVMQTTLPRSLVPGTSVGSRYTTWRTRMLPQGSSMRAHNTNSTYVSLRPTVPTSIAREPTGTGKPTLNQGRRAPHPPSTSEWNALYPLLYQLYVTEHRKLSEVMAIVERHHNFKATAQIYKKRFAAFGIIKNKRHAKTVKHTHQGYTNWQRARDACQSVSNDSGFCAPLLLCREMAGDYAGECSMYSIASWTNANFDGTRWFWINQRTKVSGVNTPVTLPSSRMYQDFSLSYGLLRRGQGQLAGLAVRKAFWQLEDVITQDDPALLMNLVDVCFHTIEAQQYDLTKVLLRQLARIATQKLPALHPLIQFFQQISKYEGNLEFLLGQAWRCFVSRLHQRMDHNFYWMLENWAWDTSIRNIDTSPREDYNRMTEALSSLAMSTEDLEAAALSRTHLRLIESTEMMKNDGFFANKSAAILKAMENISSGREVISDGKTGGYVESYLKTAEVKRAMDLGCMETAVATMQLDISNLIKVHTRASCYVIRAMWSLEKVLRESEQNEEANIVARDGMSHVEEYLSEVWSYMSQNHTA